MRPSVPDWLIHTAVLVAMIAIGAGFVATKVILGHLPALTWVAIRITATAAVLATLFGRHVIRARLAMGDHARLAGLALLGIVANQACFAVGLQHTTPAHASLINGLVPVLTLVMATAAASERWSGRKVAAIAFALPGLVVLLGPDPAGWARQTALGDAIVLINSVCYALYLVLSRPVLRRLGWQVAVTGMFVWAVPLIAALGVGHAGQIAWTELPASVWALMAFVVLGPSVGAYLTNAWALQRLDASRVALYGYVPPLAAIALAVMVVGEPVTGRLLSSMGLIFAGLSVTLLPADVAASVRRLGHALAKPAPRSLSPAGR